MKQMRYTAEQRRWAVQQMGAPEGRTVVELAKETGITGVTLRTWRKQAVARGELDDSQGQSADKWSSAAKFRAVLQSSALSQAERSEYCRTRGIEPQQLVQWHLQCEQANAAAASGGSVGAPVDHPTAQARIKELERDLRRKEAALAEAAALLILGKKADAIWGKDEEA